MSVSEAEWEWRTQAHMRICAIQNGILTHVHTDNYGRWEDPHPWPCERMTMSYSGGEIPLPNPDATALGEPHVQDRAGLREGREDL